MVTDRERLDKLLRDGDSNALADALLNDCGLQEAARERQDASQREVEAAMPQIERTLRALREMGYVADSFGSLHNETLNP